MMKWEVIHQMKSFLQYILHEATLDKKIKKGFSETPLDIPDAEVVHHDPETQTTIYHLKKPKAAYAFGGGTSWCTNSPKRPFAHSYLKRGNLFGIIKGKSRYQYHHTESALPGGSHELRDIENNSVGHFISEILPKDVFGKLLNIPHKPLREKWKQPPHPIHSMSKDEVVSNILSRSPSERLSAYRTIHFGAEYERHQDEDEHNAIAAKFDTNDLHRFHSDPIHHDFIASHGALDEVAHRMKNHPDVHTRNIIKRRIELSGGERYLIKPHPETQTINHPDQISFKFPQIRKKRTQ